MRRSHDGVVEGKRGRMCRKEVIAGAGGLMVVWTDFETEGKCMEIESLCGAWELLLVLASTPKSDHGRCKRS